jgi:hypothetical protein
MNDPTYVEASRALAGRVIADKKSPRDRVREAFRLAAARAPDSKETAVLLDLQRRKLADYKRDPEAARKLIAVGESKPPAQMEPAELASWTVVASVIFNLDETISKE